jgi:hypothetical protein
MQARITGLMLMLLAAAGSAQAIRVADEPAPAASTVRDSNPARPDAADRDDSASLREGVVTSVSPDGDRVEIQGNWLKVVAGQTRVFRRGTAVTARQIDKGAKVKFTLKPDSTLGVVYVP